MGANRYLKQFPKVAETGITFLDGYIQLGGVDGYDVISYTIPLVKSVVNTSTGVFTITLVDSWNSLRDFQVSLQATTAMAIWAQPGATDVVNAKTLVIHTMNSSAALTNPTGPCGLNVHIVLKNSYLPVGQ